MLPDPSSCRLSSTRVWAVWTVVPVGPIAAKLDPTAGSPMASFSDKAATPGKAEATEAWTSAEPLAISAAPNRRSSTPSFAVTGALEPI